MAWPGACAATQGRYLSSPTGGGVRHGTSLSRGDDINLNEAVLICNLTRSYIGFLLAALAEGK